MEPSFLTIVIVAVLIPLIIPLAYCCFAFVKDLMPSTKRQITSKKHKDVYQSKKSTQRIIDRAKENKRKSNARKTVVKAVEKYSAMLPDDVRIVNGEDDNLFILQVNTLDAWENALIFDRAPRNKVKGYPPNAACRRLIHAYIESDSLTLMPTPIPDYPTWEGRKSMAKKTFSVIGQRNFIKEVSNNGFEPDGFELWAIARHSSGRTLFNTLSPVTSPFMNMNFASKKTNRREVCTAWNALMEWEQVNNIQVKPIASNFLLRQNNDNEALREIGWLEAS